MSQLVVYKLNSDCSKTTQMSSASHWVSDGVSPLGVAEAPLPSKTSQLPMISLPGRLVPESVSTLSHPIISFEDEEPFCSSLLIDRPKQVDQPTNCSSSCDNLSLLVASGETTGDAGRLTKASSDNPIFGSGSPPVPPRDYIPRAQSRPALDQKVHKPEIHPIVQDGQKCSNTHYWLLPDKQKMSSLDAVDRTGEPGLYVNLSDAELWAKKFGIFNQITGRKKPVIGAKEHGRSHRASDDTVGRGCWSERSAEAVPLLSDVSSLDSMSVDISADDLEELAVNPSAEERTTSMGEIKEMIDRVQTKINGVTTDESYTALALHHWSVEVAVEYLKVENLFRLGLASREKCRRMLEANGWNLEKAASGLLDLVSVDSNIRKQ